MQGMDHLERLKLAEDNTKFDAAYKKANELAAKTGDNHAVISTADGRYHAIPCNTEAERTLTTLLKIVAGKFHDIVIVDRVITPCLTCAIRERQAVGDLSER